MSVVPQPIYPANEILHNQHPERIRLSSIDCPEKGQAFGKRAKQATSELVFGRDVTLQTQGHDKYGRTIADVTLPDGAHVNHTLVKDGWCWWYRKYAPGDTVLEGLEKEAREAKKGLWVDPAPILPGVYRKARRGQSLDLSLGGTNTPGWSAVFPSRHAPRVMPHVRGERRENKSSGIFQHPASAMRAKATRFSCHW